MPLFTPFVLSTCWLWTDISPILQIKETEAQRTQPLNGGVWIQTLSSRPTQEARLPPEVLRWEHPGVIRSGGRGGWHSPLSPCQGQGLQGTPGGCGNGKALARPDVQPSSVAGEPLRLPPTFKDSPGSPAPLGRLLPRWPLGPQLSTQSQAAV